MMYQSIIIGKGPAGLQAAIYLARARLNILLIGLDTGSLLRAEKVDNYYGMSIPLSGPALQKIGENQVGKLGVEIMNASAVGLGYLDSGFFVLTPDDKFTGETILIATGSTRVKIPIEGLARLEGRGVSYCAVCDGFFYRDKRVGVLGYSDYAVQEALELKAITEDVTIFTNGRKLEINSEAAKKHVNQFRIVADPVSALVGEDKLAAIRLGDGSEQQLDGLFIAYGIAGSSDFAKKLGVALTSDGSIATDIKQATNIPGVYAAGDCTGGFRQIATAVGQGAVAAKSILAFIKEK